MSEEIVKQTVVGRTRETNNNNNNNRTDKVPTLGASESRSSDYDEIGEEFDFSDSDLDEFEECDNPNNAKDNRATGDDNNVRLTEGAAEETPTNTITPTATDAMANNGPKGSSSSPPTVDNKSNSRSNEVEPTGDKTVIVTVVNSSQSLDDDVIVENDSKTETKNVENTRLESEKADGESRKANDESQKANDESQKADGHEANADTHNDDEDEDDGDYYSDDPEPEDELIVQFLGEANRIAEARLSARRQARAEAREIRLLELERQQNAQEHRTAGGVLEMSELKDAEERFRKAMIANAQLDNERASQNYQIQHLKDQLEEIGETHSQVLRELKEKTHDCSALKRNLDKLSEELKLVQGQLQERDALIADHGLVIVAIENTDGTDAKRTLISTENAQLLSSVQGSLDVRLKRFNEEKQQLRAEIQLLRDQLDHYKTKDKERLSQNSSETDDEFEAQREANKIISDYKFRLQKAEQDIAVLQANLARSETQLLRYKTAAEAAEKAESDLKSERRKLQRENREAIERLEELETENSHLLKRLDKLKNAKSALLKEL